MRLLERVPAESWEKVLRMDGDERRESCGRSTPSKSESNAAAIMPPGRWMELPMSECSMNSPKRNAGK